MKLSTALPEHSERTGDEKHKPQKGPLAAQVRHALPFDHGAEPVKMYGDKKRCMACICAERKARTVTARKPLGKLSVIR